MTLTELRDALREAKGPDRRWGDHVLFACGWRTNFTAEEISDALANGVACTGEDGDDYTAPYEEFTNNAACWYAPAPPSPKDTT